MGFLDKIFGTHSDHELKRIRPIADKVDALEEEYKKLTDAQLRGKTDEFKKRYQEGETLDDLLPEAFATMREAAWRVLGMRHYRVQVIGGIVLHQGRIAEMKTGEGKTLVATLPAYLNAIAGKTRQRVDGQGLPLPWLDGWIGCSCRSAGSAQADVRCRHYLRHKQRVWF